jgi:hypothetical protein
MGCVIAASTPSKDDEIYCNQDQDQQSKADEDNPILGFKRNGLSINLPT